MSTMFANVLRGGFKEDSNASGELKVIGAGLGRTGTASLHEALCILGFLPCHHMVSLMEDPSRSVTFRKAYDGENINWGEFFSGYNATVDNPACDFVPELMAAFPRALVLLSVRDSSESWWRSVEDTIYRTQLLSYRLSVFPIRFLREQSRVGKRIFARYERVYGVPMGPAVYELHNAYIRELVPKEKLLEFNVKEGWKPLCDFLGVSVPDVPFPHRNDTATLKENIRKAMRIGQAAWAVAFVALGIVLQQAIQRKVWTWFD